MIKPLKIPGKRFTLTKNMIIKSQENTKSNSEAARWLDISYNTYKKWSKYYGLFEQHKNQAGVGVKKGWGSYKIKLDDILDGKKECNYSNSIFKKRLVEEGYLVEECSICGWNEERVTDEKVCLNIDYINGESDDKTIDNIRLLCPNCYLSNNGFFNNSKLFCK